MTTPNNCLIIGLDGAIPELIEEYSRKGFLPNIEKLIRNGAWSENCLPPLPNVTPTCWATVATGASPATHGVTSSSLYDCNIPLTKTYENQGYASQAVKAETIWEAAERGGIDSLLISYPTSWPPKTKGIQIGTTDTSITDGTWGIKHQLFSTRTVPGSLAIELKKTANRIRGTLHPDLEKAKWILEDYIEHDDLLIKPFRWIVEITQMNEVVFYESSLTGKPLITLAQSEWSDDLQITIQIGTRSEILKYRIKVIDVSYNQESLTVYITRMVTTPLFAPTSLKPVIDRIRGIPPYRDHFNSPFMGAVDIDTYLEIQEMGFEWITHAVEDCQNVKPCGITCVYTVSIDTINHLYRNILEKECPVEKTRYEEALEIEQRTYKLIDTFVGKLLEIQQKNCLVVLVSDHSAASYGHNFDVADALKQAGLLVTRKTTHGEEIVLDKSKAIYQRSTYIYVNLDGRNPGGIVDKEDYEQVVNEIIAALYDYTDPETKCKPIALALRKDDAGIVGLRGDGIGDVVVAVGRDFGKIPGDDVHGHRLPGGQYGQKNMKTLLLLSGSGIKKGCKITRTVSLKDIAPTIAHLMRFPVPRDAEGGIIYQMLEGN